jgi:AbiTii-like protein
MTLLRRIQDAAVDSRTNIADVLRQCAVLAARLGHEPFKKWVDEELNGYEPEAELPPYRILTGLQSIGYFVGPMGEQIRNVPLPLGNVPEKYRRFVSEIEFREGAGALAAIVEGDRGQRALENRWSPDLIALLADRFMLGRRLLSASIVVAPNAIIGVVESIRNRVLKFVLEIDAHAPTAGEGEAGVSPITQERVNQVFNTTIMGGSNIAVGSTGVTQTVQVQAGDLEGLNAYLASLGLQQEDLDGLAIALKEDERPSKGQGFGKRVSAWIGDMTGKAASGTWQVGVGAAGELLATAVRWYYGLP